MRLAGLLSTAVLALALSGCGSGDTARGDRSIDRETFISTYVDLRAAALQSTERELTDERRSAVLERNGVTEQLLLEFVEVHGEDVAFMRDVWDEVELRLDASRPTIDSVPPG